ncbi:MULTISPECIES: hypothetical protein [unclassified Mesorhizobium]|uniref:hypothetical protein n=1 Tax=unclassified Mesorhizobium TaxID=325217 RepID=UPI00333B2A1D
MPTRTVGDPLGLTETDLRCIAFASDRAHDILAVVALLEQGIATPAKHICHCRDPGLM